MAETATLAINELTRSVRASSQNTSASIREHAQSQQGSMEKMLKDLYRVLSTNSRQVSSLGSSFSENISETNQVSRKIDSTNSLLQQTLSIQSTMLVEMRAMNSGLKAVAENIKSMNSGGVTSGITESGQRILSALGIGAATAAGATAGYVAAKSGEGSGESKSGAPVPQGGGGSGGNTDEISESVIKTIRQKESNNDYSAWNFTWPNGQNPNPKSTATGAYQFTASTWKGLTKKFGIGQEYNLARDAPPEIQDQIARLYVKDILRRNNNDIAAVPREWYAGPKGYLTPNELAVNRGLTVEKYIEQWMQTHNRVNRNTQVAQQPQQAPAGSTSPMPAPQQQQQSPMSGRNSNPLVQNTNFTPNTTQVSVQPANLRPPGSAMPQQQEGQGGGRVFEDQLNAPGTIRNGPISDRLKRVLQIAGAEAGVDVRVASGGQRPGEGTGSDRHDNGNAADLDLYVGNRKLSPRNPQDLPLFKKFVATAKAEGATGFGAGEGYMGDGSRIHVGFGTEAIWGKSKGNETAADWLREATGGVSSGSSQTAQMQPQQGQTRTDNMNQLDPLGMGGMPLFGAMAMPLGMGVGGPLLGAINSLVQMMSNSGDQQPQARTASYDPRVDGNMQDDTSMYPSWYDRLKESYPQQSGRVRVA